MIILDEDTVNPLSLRSGIGKGDHHHPLYSTLFWKPEFSKAKNKNTDQRGIIGNNKADE